jgi:hypothetical protein
VSARLLATLCLVFGCGSACAEPELAVYLKGAPQTPGVMQQMKRELASLMRSAGYRVEWAASSQSEMLAVVEFVGDCTPMAGFGGATSAPQSGAPLASTNVTDGRVLPFASVNCSAVGRSLGAILAREAPAQREFLYGRALARVVAHELYHIVTGTGDHTRTGISRSCFSADDLVTERFKFEGSVLAQMRRRTEPSSATDSDEGTGR